MNLEIIRTQTTWNDASTSINNNNLKINQAIEELRHQSGGVGDISVTTDKIVNGAVTTQKIAHQAVTSDKIAPNTITEEHLSKELTDGTYPNVTVGNATKAVSATTANTANRATTADRATHADTATKADFATDLTGRIEATPEVFTYRPSAGDKSIKDDNAFIRRVKGNSIRWEQKIESIPTRENFEGVTTFYDANTNEIVIQNISRSANYTSGSTRWQIKPDIYPIVGHKYLLLADRYYKGVGVQIGGIYFDSNSIFSASTASMINFRIDKSFDFASTCPIGKEIRLRMNLFDLTEMFDAGNEPTTVEEFRALYPNSYYPYNTGELRNLVCSGIKTVGFNLVDKNNFLTGVIAGSSDTPSQKSDYRYIKVPVFPNTEYYLKDVSNLYYYYSYILYDSNMNRIKAGGLVVRDDYPYNASFVTTTPSNAAYMLINVHKDFVDTCCVNLHHTGYRDGEYEPYKEVTHALPLSKITNGEPLRKAGSVYDEINETEYIRRVGVRSYTEGDKDDATLLTDGTYTNYPLDEPIVKPIETPIVFNYYVEDFGTEEAILAVNSAPFSADIIYQFNATDQVRNNTRNIQRLKKSVFTPSGTTSQYIRGDGSYADVSELSRVIPINDGEGEGIDNEDGGQNLEFRLFPQYYAKSVYTADADMYKEVIIRVEASDNTDFVAEYWFELEIGESIPQIRFENQDNAKARFRFNGEIRTDTVNIWHLITTDGGKRFFGEIKNYVV